MSGSLEACSAVYMYGRTAMACQNCGGQSSAPRPPPPPPRRNLPKQFFYQLYIKQNVGGLFGLVISLISLPLLCYCIGAPMLLFGAIIAYFNFAMAYRRHRALAGGVPVPGRIEAVHRFGPEKSTGHGSVLYRVYFRFDVEDRVYLGMKYTYGPTILQHYANESIWVGCVPRRPKYYAIWPPLA